MILMAYHFGLHPWDIDRLTISDFEMYAVALEAMNEEADKARKEQGRIARKR